MFVMALLVPCAAFAQDTAEVRRMFEAGQYQQVIETAGSTAEPGTLYAAAQSHQKLGATSEARATYKQLAARPGQ